MPHLIKRLLKMVTKQDKAVIELDYTKNDDYWLEIQKPDGNGALIVLNKDEMKNLYTHLHVCFPFDKPE